MHHFAVVIKDLEICLNNLDLPMGKSMICFEPLAQKEKN